MLAKNVSEFSKEGNICLMGDFNCRMEDFLGDKYQNKNADRLRTFLKFSGLKILNKHFSYGVPTYVYHNNGQERSSIIDLCLVDGRLPVTNFKVLNRIMGLNPHTSHRIITCSLKTEGMVRSCEGRKERAFVIKHRRVSDFNRDLYSRSMFKSLFKI